MGTRPFALHEQRGRPDETIWISPPRIGRERYDLSDETRNKGLRELVDYGLLDLQRRPVPQTSCNENYRARNAYRIPRNAFARRTTGPLRHEESLLAPFNSEWSMTAWLDERGRHDGPLWIGQRGPLTISGLTQIVLAVGAAAGIEGLRPHRLRHTYATRLRQGGADPAQVQALLGHALLDTTARYFRAGQAETAAVVERVFDHWQLPATGRQRPDLSSADHRRRGGPHRRPNLAQSRHVKTTAGGC